MSRAAPAFFPDNARLPEAEPPAMVGWRGGPLAWVVVVSFAGCASRPPLPSRALDLNERGAQALAQGDLATAEARLRVALEYSPRFTEAWVNLGLVELGRGNLERAKVYLLRARGLNPDLPSPHQGLGLLAEHRGDAREAEKHYREALRVDPGFGAARVNLGRLLFARGAFEEAREQLARLVEVSPETPEGWTGLVEVLVWLGRHDEADAVLERAVERFGRTKVLGLPLALQHLRRGELAAAEAWLMVLAVDAHRARAARAWAWLGIMRLIDGNRGGAIDAARRALTIEREDSVARYVLQRAGDAPSVSGAARTRAPR